MADPITLEWEEKGLTELIRAINEFNRTMARSERQVKDTDKETRKAAKGQDALTKQARGTSKAMRAFGDAFSGVNSGAGRATRTLGRMAGVFANLSAMGGGAGLAVAGLTAAFAGTVGAAGAAAVAVVNVSRHSRDLIDLLKPYQRAGLIPRVSPETQASFDRIEGGFNAVSVAANAVALNLAEKFSPQIEGATIGVVALTLAAGDAASAIADMLTPIGQAYNNLGVVGKAALAAVFPFAALAGEVATFATDLATTTAEEGSYVDRARDMIGVATKQAAALRNADAAAKAFKEGLDRLNGAQEAYAQIADLVFEAQSDVISAELRAYVETEKRVEQVRRLGMAVQDEATVEAAVEEIRSRAQRDRFNAWMAQTAEEQRIRQNLRREEIFNLAHRVQAEKQAAAEIQASIQQSAISTLDSTAALAGTLSEVIAREGGKGAVALFRIQQAAGIASAIVSSYVAAAKALELGPIAGPIAAGAARLQGAAAAAAIAAQPPPQVERHMGEPLKGARDPLAPDEYSAGGVRGLRQEAMTSGGMLTSQGVNALNAGRMAAPEYIPVPAPWKHLDREARRLLGNDSRTSRAVRNTSRQATYPGGRRGW